MRTKTVAAEDLRVGQRVIIGDEISRIEAIDISRDGDPYGSVAVKARREIVPAGISPTWTCADEPWNTYDVIIEGA